MRNKNNKNKINKIGENRENLSFGIDGAVIKVDNLEQRVTEIAHKVDERIIVQSAEKGKPRQSEIEKTLKKPQVIVIWLGIAVFLIGSIISYTFDEILNNSSDTSNIFGVILVVIGYFMIGHQIIYRFFKTNL